MTVRREDVADCCDVLQSFRLSRQHLTLVESGRLHDAPPPIVPTPTVFEGELTEGLPIVVEGRPTVSDTVLEGEPTVTDGEAAFGGPVVTRGLAVCWGLKCPSR